MAYTPPNPNGQATMANSSPMVIASDQSNLPANTKQINGTTVSTGNGTTDAGTQRVTLSSDSTGQVKLATGANTIGAVTGPAAAALALDSTLTGGTQQVQGNAASAATDSGNPVKIAAVFNTTRPTFTNGQRGDIQIDARGNLPVTLYSSAGTSGVNVATAADAAAATTGLVVNTRAELYNGTTWDNAREVANATNSTGTGIAAAGLLAQFDDTSPTSITENQFGNMRMSANRNLYGTIRDAAGNERGANVDASNNLMVNIGAGTANISLGGTAVKDITQFGDGVTSGVISVGQQYYRPDTSDYARWKGYMPWLPFTATADTQVKASAGFLHTVTIAATSAAPVAGLLTIYDNTAESGTVLHSEWLTTSVTSHTITLDVKASTGIYIGFDATLANVRVSGSYV